jgi:tRNA threonylcarbamoyladenosine biosynthesis protein TsaB
MKILGIDTALGACSAAVLAGDRVLAHAHEEMVRGHAEALAPMVERVMRETGLGFSELERLAVTTGPGTFTGQRVGLAFVRALAVALQRPAVGITTLDAMAAESLARQNGAWAAVVLDAKRDEIYLGARLNSGASACPPSLLTVEKAVETIVMLAASVGAAPLLVGSAAEAILAGLAQHGVAARVSDVRQPDAIFVARLGAIAAHPQEPPRPLYLRAPDAKLPSAA